MKTFLKILCCIILGGIILMMLPLFGLMIWMGAGLLKILVVLAFVGFIVYEIGLMLFEPRSGIIHMIDETFDD